MRRLKSLSEHEIPLEKGLGHLPKWQIHVQSASLVIVYLAIVIHLINRTRGRGTSRQWAAFLVPGVQLGRRVLEAGRAWSRLLASRGRLLVLLGRPGSALLGSAAASAGLQDAGTSAGLWLLAAGVRLAKTGLL
jgi:hypothetical protein